MRAWLQVLGGPEHGRRYPLEHSRVAVGQAQASGGMTVSGPGIAARHCSLRRHGNAWVVLDHGSKLGTFLNSRRLREPEILRHGDRISVGLHLLEFRQLANLDLTSTVHRLGGPMDLKFTATPHASRTAARTRKPLPLLACSGVAAVVAVVVAAGATLAVRSHVLADTNRTAVQDPVWDPVQDPTTPQPLPEPPVAVPLQPSERTHFVVEPPLYDLPDDAHTHGRPTAGHLLAGLRLPPSPDYAVRCPAHAYASSSTAAELMRGLAEFRNRSGYRGELVVGDLSRDGGGPVGPHRSHQSGRDVDLWLPISGGAYRRGCPRCGTDLCRPEPEQVDWDATWQLIQALTSTGAIQDVFLAWDLHPALREAAERQGTPKHVLAEQIQHPVRGRNSLVKHADGHTHHLHLRFRCAETDGECIARP